MIPDEMRVCAARLFELIADGTIEVKIRYTFTLLDATEAHRAIVVARLRKMEDAPTSTDHRSGVF